MTLIAQPFSDIITYSRAGGATRVNSVGRIVGVDFSATSLTIGTGSKAFTLTADADVNRDWPVGSAVIAVAQAGATGTMTGVVASYVPSTQVLTITVASVTGSGTGTAWRIGSLEFRRDFDPVTLAAKGGLVEGQLTNNFLYSNTFNNAYWIKNKSSVTPNAVISPSGNLDGFLLTEDASANSLHKIERSAVAGTGGAIFAKAKERSNISILLYSQTRYIFNLIDGTFYKQAGVAELPVKMESFSDGWWRIAVEGIATGIIIFEIVAPEVAGSTAGGAQYDGDGVSGLYIYQADSQVGSPIPTTTAQVTRAADLLAVTGSNFNQAVNPAQGTLLMEVIPTEGIQGATIASLNDGTVANDIRIAQKQSATVSSIRAIASDGVTDILGLNATGNNVIRSNGVDYNEADTGQVANGFAVASTGVGQFIVGGTSGFYSITDDGGATWDSFQLDVADRTQINDAAFGNGVYVLVGNGVGGSGLIVTIDPVTGAYTRRVSGTTATVRCVEFLNGTFYAGLSAVGGQPALIRSTDGITWVAAGTLTGSNSNSVAFGAGITLATSQDNQIFVGTNGVDIVFSGAMLSPYAPVSGLARQWLGSNFANGIFVVVGSQGAIITSTTGLNGSWTLRTSGTASNLHSVMYSTRDSQWYAAGDGGTILRSTDAITWESIANDAIGAVISGGNIQANPFLPNLIPNATNKIAMRLEANNIGVSVNGATAATDTSAALPSVNQLVLGGSMNGHIQRIRVLTGDISDAELAELST